MRGSEIGGLLQVHIECRSFRDFRVFCLHPVL